MSTALSGSAETSIGLWGKGILPTWSPLPTSGVTNSSQSLVIFIYTTVHATQNPLGLRKSPN